MTERRMARRYELSLPVVIRTASEPEHSSGRTRDISTRGVYFTVHREMTPGMELDFTLTLPAEITRGPEVYIRAYGRVVRVERRQNGELPVGIAAVIEKYDIIRAETGTA
ncbi:MAG: PilZ domain-containing protein [Firmicutes bacterium]|nr:PilZ domain-containing protein [Bacillota bacterium]